MLTMTTVKSMTWKQKDLWKILKIEHKMYQKRSSKKIPKNPGMKILGESRPGKSRDHGIMQKSRPGNPGIKIPENAGACPW